MHPPQGLATLSGGGLRLAPVPPLHLCSSVTFSGAPWSRCLTSNPSPALPMALTLLYFSPLLILHNICLCVYCLPQKAETLPGSLLGWPRILISHVQAVASALLWPGVTFPSLPANSCSSLRPQLPRHLLFEVLPDSPGGQCLLWVPQQPDHLSSECLGLETSDSWESRTWLAVFVSPAMLSPSQQEDTFAK